MKEKETGSNFCIVPWISMHVYADGQVFPCCVFDKFSQLGNTREKSMEQIWNDEPFMKLRQDFMNNVRAAGCKNCWDAEDRGAGSLRTGSNYSWKHHFNLLDQTTPEGKLEKFSTPWLDIIFSNVCNLKCRTCWPASSTALYPDYEKLFGKPDYAALQKPKNDMAELMKEIERLADTIEEIHFHGGEPLIHQEHYDLLDSFIAKGRTNVKLRYNTNMSVRSFRGRSIFDIWNKFKNVQVMGSLDGIEERGEYIRQGLNWKETEVWMKELRSSSPHIDFIVSSVASWPNAFHLSGMHRYLCEQKLIKTPGSFEINLLQEPSDFRLQALPQSYTDDVVKEWQKHIIWLKTLPDSGYAIQKWEDACRFINSHPRFEHRLKDFKSKAKMFDKLYGTKPFPEIFPEFSKLWDEIQDP